MTCVMELDLILIPVFLMILIKLIFSEFSFHRNEPVIRKNYPPSRKRMLAMESVSNISSVLPALLMLIPFEGAGNLIVAPC